MAKEHHILSTCTIRENSVVMNSESVFTSGNAVSSKEFSKQAYQHFNLKYPKFHKMDLLSKLGIIAADLLLKENPVSQHMDSEDIGVILMNRSSSLLTDIEFNATISNPDNFFPSPALFVYTLPNIVIGEICIKHKLNGENAFFILNKFDPCFLFEYVVRLFQTNRIKACICGWVEVDVKGNYDVCMFVVGENDQNTTTAIELTAENLDYLFQNANN